MNRIKKRIGLRLLRYVFGCYIIIAVIVTGIQLNNRYINLKVEVFNQIYGIENSFKDSFINSLWSFDTPQLDVILSGMMKINAVSGVKIVTEDLNIIASVGHTVGDDNKIVSSKKLKNRGIKEIELISDHSDKPYTVFEYSFPLEYADSNGTFDLIGYGFIYTDADTIIERVKYSFLSIVFFSLIKSAALWLIFLFFMNKFIARPLDFLASAASAINPDKIETLKNSKDLDHLIEAKHEDELFYLASNFNQMRIAIVDKLNVIESQKNKLEERVLARTRLLSEANEELKHLALHDALTSLPNRALFQDRIEQYIKTGQRNDSRFIIASLDLTKFKEINDNYGHQIGDIVLTEVGKRLSGALRKTDTVARMGGDEFCALFAVGNNNDGKSIIGKFLKCLEAPILCEGTDVKSLLISVNIGTAIYPQHGETSNLLLKNADMALYQAKREGVNHILYSPEADLRLKRESQLGRDFNQAIEKNELFLLYQPILDIKSNRVTKLEALVRWQHPTLGLISPVEFIPICERNGSIIELTQWVFMEACKQCKTYFNDSRSISVSINLSGRVFSQPEIPEILEEICKSSDIPPKNINLEVTETTAMEKPEQAIDILNELTNKGFTISIDDFGTGYSSFSYLIMLPVNELKIDKSFLLSNSRNRDQVIKTMIDLAHSLELKVVAEGVETEDLLNLLGDMNCNYAQGYHISRPISAVDMDDFLLAH